MSNPSRMFNKVVAGKNSPRNGCYVDDDEILVPGTPDLAAEAFDFTGVSTFRSSRYGWVKSTDAPFTITDFAIRYNLDLTSERMGIVFMLFEKIAKLPDGAVVAGSFFKRGIERRTLEFDFHRVFFYENRGSASRLPSPGG